MTTTLPLIETIKIDTRRDGAISYANVRVELDGAQLVTDFRARVGEEPVVIDGDTITVSDAQIQRVRGGIALRDQMDAEDRARATARIEAEVATTATALRAKGASEEAIAEVAALMRAAAPYVLDHGASDGRRRFLADKRAILVRDGLF
jgi:hypothetical protein